MKDFRQCFPIHFLLPTHIKKLNIKPTANDATIVVCRGFKFLIGSVFNKFNKPAVKVVSILTEGKKLVSANIVRKVKKTLTIKYPIPLDGREVILITGLEKRFNRAMAITTKKNPLPRVNPSTKILVK